MNIIGILRVKNGEKYLPELFKQLNIFCERILILDNQSTDRTVEIAKTLGAEIQLNTKISLHEGRDRILLHKWAGQYKPDWIFAPEVNDLLEEGGPDRIKGMSTGAEMIGLEAFQSPYLYLWGDNVHYRVDGSYRSLAIRLFKYFPDLYPPNRMTNSSAIAEEIVGHGRFCRSEIRIFNSSLMTPELRLEKYDYYRKNHPPDFDNFNRSLKNDYDHILGRNAEIEKI